MNLLRTIETLLHVGGCVVLMYGVIVTIFMIAATTEHRPMGLHPVQFGMIFAVVFAAAGSFMLVAATLMRKRFDLALPQISHLSQPAPEKTGHRI